MNKFQAVRRFFCSKNPLQKEKDKYIYDKKAFDKVNNAEFVKKMEKMERAERG